MYLDESTVPEGYKADPNRYKIIISARAEIVEEGVPDVRAITRVLVITYSIDVEAIGYKVSNTKITKTAREDDSVVVVKVDSNEETEDITSAATFTLYNGSDKVMDLTTVKDEESGQWQLTIDTKYTEIAELLEDLDPNETSKLELTLKETEASIGYEVSDTEYTVTINGESGDEELIGEGEGSYFLTTTVFSIDLTVEEIPNEKDTDTDRVDDSITITKTDDFDNLLAGAEFTLYDEEGEEVLTVTTGDDGKATISTGDEAFEELLPDLPKGEELDKELVLKETEAPAGYMISEEAEEGYAVVVHGEAVEELDTAKKQFITTTTYTIAFATEGEDGEESTTDAITVVNEVKYGDLEIVKIVPVHEEGRSVSFTFRVVATFDTPNGAQEVLNEIFFLTFTEPGEKTIPIDARIPVGSTVKVTEIDDGTAYKLDDGYENPQIVTITDPDDETQVKARAEFSNSFIGEIEKGHGILNTFTLGEDGQWVCSYDDSDVVPVVTEPDVQ